MNEVGGVQTFLVWVEFYKNPAFKIRKAGHCVFCDLIPITMVALWPSERSPQVGVAKPSDKGIALPSVVHSQIKSKIGQEQ